MLFHNLLGTCSLTHFSSRFSILNICIHTSWCVLQLAEYYLCFLCSHGCRKFVSQILLLGFYSFSCVSHLFISSPAEVSLQILYHSVVLPFMSFSQVTSLSYFPPFTFPVYFLFSLTSCTYSLWTVPLQLAQSFHLSITDWHKRKHISFEHPFIGICVVLFWIHLNKSYSEGMKVLNILAITNNVFISCKNLLVVLTLSSSSQKSFKV